MMGTGNNNPRLRGVQTPPGQVEHGAPKTINKIGPALEMHPVEFVDKNGVRQVTIAVKIGDQLYLPANGAEWIAGLRPALDWFKKEWSGKGGPALTRPDQPDPTDLPKEDAVDIMEGGASEPEAK